MSTNRMPAGVTVLAFVHLLAALGCIITWLVFVIGGGFLFLFGGTDAWFGAGVASVLGWLFLAVAVFRIVVAVGLFRGRSWARVVSIACSLLMVLYFFAGGVGWLSLIIHSVTIWYLGFNKNVQRAFR